MKTRKPVTLRCAVAAVAGVGEDALDLVADGLLHVRDHRRQCVAVVGIAGQGLCIQDELAALRAFQRGGDGDLGAELVRPVRLALVDAFPSAAPWCWSSDLLRDHPARVGGVHRPVLIATARLSCNTALSRASPCAPPSERHRQVVEGQVVAEELLAAQVLSSRPGEFHP